MKKAILSLMAICSLGQVALAFCGFYVAKAGADLYNKKSEVILVRDGKKTTITMSNDFKGSVKDFAMVVPVPNVLARDDIRIADRSVFQMLDAYSAPRLVEYFDQNPCQLVYPEEDEEMMLENVAAYRKTNSVILRDKIKYSVTIEAQYKVDEYDIILLSAKRSGGLKKWLVDNGYSIPARAEQVLEPYIKSGLKFFVVKVDLNKYNPKKNGGFLRPLQITVKSAKFTLPIRLGMANSKGEQDLIVYAFSKKGRVECSNYRTVEMPTNKRVPTFLKPNFGNFYSDVFRNQYGKQGKNAIFLEYAWNVTPTWSGVKCDPCVGNPPYAREFLMAGVPWANTNGTTTYFTRMHVRYTLDKFPEDLFFIETPNKEHYQARYVITHPAQGDLSCNEGKRYTQTLKLRRESELRTLTKLSQWDTNKFYDYVANGTGKTVSMKKSDENSFWSVGLKDVGDKGPRSGLLFAILTLLLSYLVHALWVRRRLAGT